MYRLHHSCLIVGLFAGFLFNVVPSQAQYTADFQTNVISGVTSNWNGEYLVGNTNSSNALLVQNGGVLSETESILGNTLSSSNNSVLVTDPGSIWIAGLLGFGGIGNSMVISNGGQVFGDGAIGIEDGSRNSSVYVVGQGSLWNAASLLIGADGLGLYGGNSVVIRGGAQLASTIGIVSYSNNFNTVVVEGRGSIWTNTGALYVGYFGADNSVMVSDGGQMVSSGGTLGYASTGYSNSVQVIGPGSTWNNSGDVTIGNFGYGNSLVISNGGRVVNGSSTLKSSNNTVFVTGPGSVWSNENGGLFLVSGDASNAVVINNGGQVFCAGGSIVNGSNSSVSVVGSGSIWSNCGNDQVSILGSSLVISNRGFVSVGGRLFCRGTTCLVTIANDGSLVVGGALITFSAGNLDFRSGYLSSGGSEIASDSLFPVGDGIHVATYHMTGGTYSFSNGLEIRSNAFLSGCGTISGDILVDVGGTVLADCGGTSTFTGVVTNNGILRATNGSLLEFGGPIVNNGLIDVMGGKAQFDTNFINNGVIADAAYFRVSNITRQGNDINLTWNTVGGRSNVVQVATCDGTGYSTNFADLSPVIGIPGASLGTTNYLDIAGATNSSCRFYRVRLVP